MKPTSHESAPRDGGIWHEFASLFPMMDGKAFDDLTEDVRAHGVREPVVFFEGKVLDGRNRYMAACGLGLEYPRAEFEGDRDAALAFVISTNLHRRHLTDKQRLDVGAKLATMPHGGDRRSDQAANSQIEMTDAQAAALMDVPVRSLGTMKAIHRDAVPELVVAAVQGPVSLDAAAAVATLPAAEQVEIVAKGEKAILEAAKAIRAERAEKSREVRLERIAEISKGNAELSVATRYPVIYADPPWRYENPPIGGSNRSIENHYPTMTLEEICALPVAALANDDAILYLWATAPKLAECMKVIEAWGFEYRTNLVWDKEVIGMGYHARNQHEILLVAKRGSIPPPAAGTQPSSVHRERRGDHSAKPHFYYEMIEGAYPGLPKIELFCRSPRDGWAVWGNQSGVSDAA